MKEAIKKDDGKEMKKLWDLAGLEMVAGMVSGVLASVLGIRSGS